MLQVGKVVQVGNPKMMIRESSKMVGQDDKGSKGKEEREKGLPVECRRDTEPEHRTVAPFYSDQKVCLTV